MDTKIKSTSTKDRHIGQKTRVEQVIDLIKRIERADNLASIDIQKKVGEKLQILPGNQTGVVSSLSLR